MYFVIGNGSVSVLVRWAWVGCCVLSGGLVSSLVCGRRDENAIRVLDGTMLMASGEIDICWAVSLLGPPVVLLRSSLAFTTTGARACLDYAKWTTVASVWHHHHRNQPPVSRPPQSTYTLHPHIRPNHRRASLVPLSVGWLNATATDLSPRATLSSPSPRPPSPPRPAS